jgi:hypothetical protein
VTTTTPLTVGGTPLQLVDTTEANANDSVETTAVELTFTIDGTWHQGAQTGLRGY